jgi:hypothetical protein
MSNAFYYIYSFIVFGIFLYNCRSWRFIRVTILYFVFMTFFACLLIYGSAYSLDANFAQWHRALLTTFPLSITGGGPDATTISKNSPAFWQNLIPLIAFFATFPQAVMRSASLTRGKSSKEVMRQITQTYSGLRRVAEWLKIATPGTISNFYAIGEWAFTLVAFTSLASPFPMRSFPLMLLGCFFVIMLAGSDIVAGTGLVSLVLKLIIPGIIAYMQRITVLAVMLILAGVSILIGIYAGFILLSLTLLIFHTHTVGTPVIIILVVLSLGVMSLCFFILKKVVFFPLRKLVEWMEIEIIDPEVS